MAKQFSDVNGLNIVFMFKYMFCNTQILTGANSDRYNFVLTRITSVLIEQFLDD